MKAICGVPGKPGPQENSEDWLVVGQKSTRFSLAARDGFPHTIGWSSQAPNAYKSSRGSRWASICAHRPEEWSWRPLTNFFDTIFLFITILQSLEDAHTGKVWVEIFCAQLTKLNFVVDVDFFLSASMSAIFFCRPPWRPPCLPPCRPPCQPPYRPPQCGFDALWGLRDADRMEIRKYHGRTYGLIGRGRCVSKNVSFTKFPLSLFCLKRPIYGICCECEEAFWLVVPWHHQ